MPAFLAAFLAPIAARLSKAAGFLIVVCLLLVAAAFLGWLSLRAVDAMVDDARTTTAAARDAYWQGKIEAANAYADRAASQQIREALQIQSVATDKVRTAEQELADLKVKNEQLPSRPDCGLSAERGRMLPN